MNSVHHHLMSPARHALPLLLASIATAQVPTFGLSINGVGPIGEFSRSDSGSSFVASAPPPKQTFTLGVEFHAWISHPFTRALALRSGLSLSRANGSYSGPGVLSLDLVATSFCLRADALVFPWGDAKDFRGTYLVAGLGLDVDKVDRSSDQLHIFDPGVDRFQSQDAVRPGATFGLGHVFGRRSRMGGRWMWELGFHTTLDRRSPSDPPRTTAFKAGLGVVF